MTDDLVRASWEGGGDGWTILVHGGAGDVPAERRASHAEGCRLAADAGKAILASGGSALDAVQRAVELLEDDPRFNAGTGASLDEDGELRLDAAIMSGDSLRGGAVASLSAFRHPIAVARAVLVAGTHVLYGGEGAAVFARAHGFSDADPHAMITEASLARLAATRRGESGNWAGGTVGAVARDVAGHVAAATSTGGLVGKPRGRIGDSPILGAGTYADDNSGAVSGTGEGEGYLRAAIAARICLWLESGVSVREASERAIRFLGDRVSASGGIIVVDRFGRAAFARSTQTMSWASATAAAPATLSGTLNDSRGRVPRAARHRHCISR